MKYLELVVSLGVIVVGVTLYQGADIGTPPSLSGIGFTLVGISLLINNYIHHMR